MTRIRKYRPSPATAIAIAALVVALGGAAFAAIPDSNGTIHGCYQKANGNLRVVESSSDCRNLELALAWNQRGTPGPPGPPGRPGGSSVHTLGQTIVPDGQSQTLFTRGPLSFTGRCRLNVPLFPAEQPPDRDVAEIFISTTQDHSALGGDEGQNFDFNASTPEQSRLALRALNNPGQAVYLTGVVAAAAPDGTSLTGVLWASVNALGQGGKCVFGGHLVVD